MKLSPSTYWRSMASGADTSVAARITRTLFIPLSAVYAIVQNLRVALFASGILRSKKLPRPVISVGNIAVGGTGKTPVTAYVAGFLLAEGLRVAVLSRGYGGSSEGQTRIVSDGKDILLSAHECGDEPFLLASTIPGLMVIIGADRYEAGRLAMEQLSPDVFLLDDGYQHLRLQRDLNILLLDYTRPYGNGWCLPAGLLREPRQSINRADLVILTRSPDGAVAQVAGSDIQSCCASHHLNDLVPLGGGPPHDFASLAGRKILAVAGIAEPESFFAGLRESGMYLVETVILPDHTAYDTVTLNEISDTYRLSGADLVVTTEKDGVKLATIPHALSEKILLCRLTLQLVDPAPVVASLRNLLQK